VSADKHRLDLWLKLVCVFKHRTEATEACKGGHVKLGGQRCKPSALVREGDTIEIVMEDRYRRLVVTGLPERQVSKEIARTMYRDETPPQAPRAREPRTAEREAGAGRPTKRDRREIDRWRR